MSRNKTVETLTKELETLMEGLGVEYEGLGDKSKVYQIKVKLEPEVWADLANTEGELLGVCCANVSTMRDCFIGALREDGWMRFDDLQTLVVNMAGHDWDKLHPATKLKEIYEKIKDYGHESSGTQGYDLNNPEDALEVINHFCNSHIYGSMYQGWPRFQDKVNHNFDISSVLPAIHTIANHLKELGFGPVEGFAIVSKKTGKVFEIAGGRVAIYETKEMCEEVIGHWLSGKQTKKNEPIIIPCRVGMEKGIEFLEELPDSKYIRLRELVRDMDVPVKNKNSTPRAIGWLKENLEKKNKDHKNFEETMVILEELTGGK